MALDQKAENLFISRIQQANMNGSIFGGHVVCQSLLACSHTLDSETLSAHSMHAYFLRSGNPELPVEYHVDPVRDGRSFSFRQVKAIQEGKVIFTLGASFQIEEEGLEHQEELPEGAIEQLNQYLYEKERDGEEPKLLSYGNFETVPNLTHSLKSSSAPTRTRGFWFRSTDTIPKGSNYQKAALAYLSDLGPTAVMASAHAKTIYRDLKAASLDHAVWFHSRDINVNEWTYSTLYTSRASGARGIAHGAFFSPDGTMIASSTQEGLIRVR